MKGQNASPAGSGGSMRSFWIVIALAAVILGAYLLRTGLRGGAPAGLVPSDHRSPAGTAAIEPVTPGASSVDLASLKGKVVVLHFWATWCPPCRAEFPEFARYAEAHQGNPGIAILPVSVDNDKASVLAFLQAIPQHFPVYIDQSGLADQMGVTAIPTTVVLDREGKVAWTAQGATDWSPKGVPAVVRKLDHE